MSRYTSSPPSKYVRDAKPAFIIKPRRCFADEGGAGKFKASFDGEPLPAIEWVRKGVKIEPSDKHRIFTEKDFHYLEISDVTTEDRGQYTCVLSNTMGTTRVTAELEVYPSRNKPRKLEPLSNLKKISKSSEKLTKSTERLNNSREKLMKNSQKFAKSSENLTSGFSLAPTSFNTEIRQKSSVTSRLSVQTASSGSKDGSVRRERSPRREKSPRREQSPPKSPPKSPSTLRNVKSRLPSRRFQSDDVIENVSTKLVKTEIRSSNRMTSEIDESRNKESPKEYMPQKESHIEYDKSETEVEESPNEDLMSQKEATVTSTKTVNMRSTRHIDIDNNTEPASNASTRTERTTSSISMNIGGRTAPDESKLSSVRSKFESKSSDTTAGTSTKLSLAPKLSSVRNKFESATARDSGPINKAKTYGAIELKKAGISRGKLASLSQKFAAMDSQDTGPILPKPPPQPGTAFSRSNTSQRSNTITLKVTPPTQGNKTTTVREPQIETRIEKSRTEIERKPQDIPEISISSEMEFKVTIPQAQEKEQEMKDETPETSEDESEPEIEIPETDIPKAAVIEESKPVMEKTRTSTTKIASHVSKISGKSLDIPASDSNSKRDSSKERASKISGKSLDVPGNSHVTRTSARDRVSQSPSRAKTSPRASPVPRIDSSPRRDVTARKDLSPRRDVPSRKDASPRRGTSEQNDASPTRDVSERKDASPRRDVSERKDASPRRDVSERKDASPRREVSERTDASPRRDASERKDASPRRDVSERTDANPRRDVSERKDASPRRDVSARTDASPRRDASERTEQSPGRDVTSRKDLSPRRDVRSASPARVTHVAKAVAPPLKSTKAASPPSAAPKTEAAPTRQRSTRVVPILVRGLKDLEVNDGESVTLKCSFNGSPSPTVSWYFNGAILKDSDEIEQQFDGEVAQLKFKDVFPDDTGRYEAIATNRIGEAKTSCIVTVKDAKPPMTAPAFTKPLQDMVVCDGDQLTFRAHYTGNPEPQMAWFHSGKEMMPSKDFKISFKEGVAILEVIEVFPEDQGLYELIANNEIGETKTVCKLTVKEPGEKIGTILQRFGKKAAAPDDDKPIFIRPLKNLTVHDGEKITLQVEVTGDAPIEVCWIHDKEEINPADQSVYQVVANGNIHKLTIPDVLPEDQGTWSCEAYNHYGDAVTSCVLTVKEPRDDKHPMTSAEMQRDDSFGEDVQRDQNILQTRKNKIRNEDTFQVPKFIIKPKSVNTMEGNSARFVCEVVGNPQPDVAWFFDARELLPGGRFKTTRDGWKHIFEISHTLATDAGKYECQASNNQGLEKCTITLVVKRLESPQGISDFRTLLKSRPALGGIGKSPQVEVEAEQVDFRAVLTRHVKTKSRPKILQELRDQKAYEGSPVTLQCKVTGTPLPTIAWFMGKKEIKESKFFHTSYEQTCARLEISGVYPEDQGEYLCVAENDAGAVQSKCDIVVLESPQSPTASEQTTQSAQYIHSMDAEEPPFIEDLQPENISVLRADKFKLKAKFVGSEPLTIEWIRGKNTELLPDDRIKIETVRDTTSLTVLKCQSLDTGKYTVCLSNEYGTDSMSASVTVEDKPDAPVGQPVASNIKTNSLTLAWSGPSYDGGTQVTDYRVEMCVNGQTNWKTLTSNCKHTSFSVQGLESNTEYIFRISAANKHGFGPPSGISDVIVPVVRHFSAFSELDIMTFTPREVVVTPGRTFKEYYTLGEEIGKGRFGNVHTCVEKSTSQQFAAKFIKVKPSQRAEMKQEMMLMNILHHPKLLLLWDAFESPREMILVMEHVKGGELFERIIDDDYCLTERECVHFMRQLCDGIEFMHEQNILHLDLKPENILCITPNSNEIKIIDFGLARQFDPSVATKVLFGTPEFVAPEVINYDQIGYATDMWSVGVICYILVSGLSPFLGDNEPETLANVTMATWDFDDEVFDDISDDAKDFITQLLLKNMRKRMSVNAALVHKWMSQDVKYMRAKRLSTAKHKRFMARRKWQKTGHAIRALGRMASLQKALCVSRQTSSNGSTSSRSRQSSLASDVSVTSDRQSVSSDRPNRLSRGSNRLSREESVTEILDNSPSVKSREMCKDEFIDDAFENKTSAIKTESDLNSNDLEFDKNNKVNSITNGYSKPIDHEVSTPETTSPEVTSPEVMSQDESDDNVEQNNDTVENSTEINMENSSNENVENSVEEVVENSDEEESEDCAIRQESADGSPVFQKDLSDFKAYDGDSARFDAQVSGNPEPDIQWLKNDNPIVVNRRKFVMDYGEKGKCSLIIKYCGEDDEAKYTCRAMNDSGQATSHAQLRVKTF